MMKKFMDICMLSIIMFVATGCDLFEKDYDYDIVSTNTVFKVEGEYEYDSQVDQLYLNIDDIEYRQMGNLMVTDVTVSLFDKSNSEAIDSTSNTNEVGFNLNEYLDNVELSSSFKENEFKLENIYVEISHMDVDGNEVNEKIEFKKSK